MTLTDELLAAILKVTNDDEPAAVGLARRWEATFEEAAGRAERIRRQVADSRCACIHPVAPAGGRCRRCCGAVR
jgi:hypothetical protein